MSSSFTTPAGMFIGATQALANQAALNYACQQARLARPTNCQALDMPLTSAIYLSSAGKIYGARAGYLFEFDANGVATGRTLQFGSGLLDHAYMALDPSGNLWVSNPCDADNFERNTLSGLYKINTSTMAVSQFVPWDGNLSVLPATQSDMVGGLNSGPRAIAFKSDGSLLVLTAAYFGTGIPGSLVLVETNAGFTAITAYKTNQYSPSFDTPNFGSLYHDSVSGKTWIGYQPGMVSLIEDGGGSFNHTEYAHYGSFPMTGGVYGFAYCPTDDNFYMVTRSADLLLLNKTTPLGGFTVKSIGAVKPRNIRYVPHRGTLFVPTMENNTVLEIAVGGTVSNTFTGFDLPWDIVDTGSKVFAVQLGKVGLKQVTT